MINPPTPTISIVCTYNYEQDPRLQGRAPGFRGKGYQVRDKTGIRQGQDRDKSGARQRKVRDKIREGKGMVRDR